jgi:putative oxidoreductase
MCGHGLQKLNGSFGGPGLQATEQTMRAIGMEPAKLQAWAVALSETVGGGLTAAGFLSPLGPAMITGTMAVAIKKVHAKNGLWLSNRGYEYNLILIAAAFAAGDGPGPLSIDGLIRKQRSGLRWAIAQLALGLGVAAVTMAAADRLAPAQTAPAEAPHNGSVSSE